MSAESTVKTVWEGDLPTGREETTVSSGTFAEFEVSWPARTERSTGTTSPEELLAAAHSSCWCMALSAALGKAGNPPECLEASANGAPECGPWGTLLTLFGLELGLDPI